VKLRKSLFSISWRLSLISTTEWPCFYRDGDSVLDINDNCQEVPNGDQSDIDGDGKGK